MEDQLLLTLMKLRKNFPHKDLAVRFDVSVATVTNVFLTFLHALHEIFFRSLVLTSMPSFEKVRLSSPECFSNFANCRQIWDCTDIHISTPRENLAAQRVTYSQYRGGYTLKGLVCVSPNGAITWLSELYAGGISDKEIVRRSGILSTLSAGDLILADKGFLVADILPHDVHINIPSFLDSDTRQFTQQQISWSRSISRYRIHVERAIQRLKEFRILRDLPHNYRCYATEIFQLCGTLINTQRPILKSSQQNSDDL